MLGVGAAHARCTNVPWMGDRLFITNLFLAVELALIVFAKGTILVELQADHIGPSPTFARNSGLRVERHGIPLCLSALPRKPLTLTG